MQEVQDYEERIARALGVNLRREDITSGGGGFGNEDEGSSEYTTHYQALRLKGSTPLADKDTPPAIPISTSPDNKEVEDFEPSGGNAEPEEKKKPD